MSKHTPGPWTACIEGEIQQFGDSHEIQAGEHWACVASVPFESRGSTHGEEGETHISADECIANARLIAAAPDLLQALATLITRWEHDIGDDLPPAVVQARAAIAKATGAAQ